MGVYSEYLGTDFGFKELTEERKKQLRRISEIRGRDVLVFAADLTKGMAPISIYYADLLPIRDQLDNLEGSALDLILESPGGSGEVAEDIIRLLRDRYDDLAVIVPGHAKSAATIMCMAADDILMDAASSLGPIDAQLFWQGKVFSADALLKGFEKIKEEVTRKKTLNRAYIPILQGISPGELENAENALRFAEELVTQWLAQYKFRGWKRRSNGRKVTDRMRRARARRIAKQLSDHGRWLTHGRSLKIADLEGLKLKITDFSADAELADAIRRYYTLLQMTFATNLYKIFETVESQIYRFIAPGPAPPPDAGSAGVATVELVCENCGHRSRVQANLGTPRPLEGGALPFPEDNRFVCPNCGKESNLGDLRRQIEAQSGKPVVG